jgi:glycosyltransferase involved in cell wall biosynthesis
MIKGKMIVVVLPAYNAEQTLEKTIAEIDRSIVDRIILVDDASKDATVNIASKMEVLIYRHQVNLGYGGNQKTCYKLALEQGADIVVMLHPDYQYDPRLILAMSSLLVEDVYDVVLGSRILGSKIVSRGMPWWRWAGNRCLTFLQNLLLREKLSEYHTGYRAFRREVLQNLPLGENSDDFIFDNEILCQAILFNYRIGEVSCPTRYLKESSSISCRRSIIYGLGVLKVTLQAVLEKSGLIKCRLFRRDGKKLKV